MCYIVRSDVCFHRRSSRDDEVQSPVFLLKEESEHGQCVYQHPHVYPHQQQGYHSLQHDYRRLPPPVDHNMDMCDDGDEDEIMYSMTVHTRPYPIVVPNQHSPFQP
jgi:hypothetical protein